MESSFISNATSLVSQERASPFVSETESFFSKSSFASLAFTEVLRSTELTFSPAVDFTSFTVDGAFDFILIPIKEQVDWVPDSVFAPCTSFPPLPVTCALAFFPWLCCSWTDTGFSFTLAFSTICAWDSPLPFAVSDFWFWGLIPAISNVSFPVGLVCIVSCVALLASLPSGESFSTLTSFELTLLAVLLLACDPVWVPLPSPSFSLPFPFLPSSLQLLDFAPCGELSFFPNFPFPVTGDTTTFSLLVFDGFGFIHFLIFANLSLTGLPGFFLTLLSSSTLGFL